MADLDGGRFFFNAVKEGDSVVFAADDEAESHLWVMALYRATGQSHKPTPPLTPSGKSSTIAKIQGGKLGQSSSFSTSSKSIGNQLTASLFTLSLLMCNVLADTDRARKHGMEEYISADPVKFEHSLLFKLVQTLTLDFRLNDPYASLVRKPRPLTIFIDQIYCLSSFINMDRLALRAVLLDLFS